MVQQQEKQKQAAIRDQQEEVIRVCPEYCDC